MEIADLRSPFCRVCMKYISQAIERLKTKDSKNEKELSLVERILANNPDPKVACILALDLILVGIDTVSLDPFFRYTFFIFRSSFLDLDGDLLNFVSIGNET